MTQAAAKLAAEVSHSTRSELSVLLAAFEDLKAGIELGEQDIEDGLCALVSIRELLDILSVFSQLKNFRATTVPILELSEELGQGEVSTDLGFLNKLSTLTGAYSFHTQESAVVLSLRVNQKRKEVVSLLLEKLAELHSGSLNVSASGEFELSIPLLSKS